MASMLAVPETISSSQARPRAMDLISAVRRSAFIGRGRDLAVEAGSRISLNLLAGGFVQGINSLNREQRYQANHRAHPERHVSTVRQVENIVEELVLLIP